MMIDVDFKYSVTNLLLQHDHQITEWGGSSLKFSVVFSPANVEIFVHDSIGKIIGIDQQSRCEYTPST